MIWISTRRPTFWLWPIGVWTLLSPGCGLGAGAPVVSKTDPPGVGAHESRVGTSLRSRPAAPAAAVQTPPEQAAPTSSPPTPSAPLVTGAANVSSVRKPEPVTPPFSASARPGDGEWIRYGGGEGSPPVMWRTTLHPHRSSAFISVSVVAIDLQTYGLDWVVGSADDGADELRAYTSVGLLEGEAAAVFNGGFQARHGHWGQVSHGVILVPPRPEGCGVALTTDGHVELGTYADLEPLGLVTYRQTPPCLVTGGTVNAALLAGRDKLWAGKSEREKTRRRSALGLSHSSRTLYYLVGVETDALDLARALSALGADVGVQLDINWNWTRFFLVGQKDGSPEVHSPLLDGMVMDAGEYVKRPSKRDFFVVRPRF